MSDAHSETVFDKILSGELPCYRVYEDAHVLAFLDIGPLSPGHTLVIPKERKAQVHLLSDESAAAIGRVLPRLCRAVLRATGATAYNLLQNNGAEARQEVMHVHFHIIPRIGERGLSDRWNAGSLDAAEAERLLTAMREALDDEAGLESSLEDPSLEDSSLEETAEPST
ncbi:MAG: HIT family protein [Acidobacteriota bacterium]